MRVQLQRRRRMLKPSYRTSEGCRALVVVMAIIMPMIFLPAPKPSRILSGFLVDEAPPESQLWGNSCATSRRVVK